MKTTIYNMDSLEYLSNLSDNSIDLIITDPPYEISTVGGGCINKKTKHI